jgi:alpha-beta hydrolase superfamily lysophospholipase
MRFAFLLRPARWMWRHKILSALAAFAILFVAVNILAYMHARAMTHFTAGGERTEKPEALSFGQEVKTLFTGVNIPRPENRTTPADLGLKFTVQHMQASDGTVLEAWCIPCAEPRGVVVMGHSYAASKSHLLREARAFHELGYVTLLLDFRGSGGSEGNETTIGVREADDMFVAAESARFDLAVRDPNRPLILYGQSMGSAAVLRAIAVHGLDPDAVILECPFDRLVSTVGNRFQAMKLPAFPGAQLLVFWGGVQNRFNGFAHNPCDYARDVHCPVLLMHGTSDPRVSREQIDNVFENLAGEKELVLMEGAGHEPYLDSHSAEWKAAVSTFLKDRGVLNPGRLGP